MMYLLKVMDALVNGEPMTYRVAECWKALGGPAFAPFVKHKQKCLHYEKSRADWRGLVWLRRWTTAPVRSLQWPRAGCRRAA